MSPRFFFCLWISFLALSTLSAQETPAEPDQELREQTVYIPYEKLKNVFEQPGRGVFLPYDEFQKLWDASRTRPKSTPSDAPPVAAMMTEMDATVRVDDEVVRVESTIGIELFKDGWHEIPLSLHNVALTQATVDGQTARILGSSDGYKLLLEKKSANKTADATEKKSQRIELKLQFAKNIEKSPGRNSVAFDVPQTPLGRWTVIVPQSGVKVDFAPLVAAAEDAEKASKEDETKAETVFRAFTGPTPQVRIAWTPKAEGATGLDALTSVQLLQRCVVDEGILRTSANFEYSISRSEISELSIRAPKDQKIVSVFDPNIRKWSVEQDGELQTVKIELFEAAKARQTVVLELEKLFDIEKLRKSGKRTKGSTADIQKEPDQLLSGEEPKETEKPKRFSLAIPELAAIGVGRQQGVLVVRSAGELTTEAVKTNGLLRMDLSELPENLRRAGQPGDFLYRISSTAYALELSVDKVEPRITARSQIAVRLLADALRTEMLTLFQIERAGVFQFSFEIPDGVRDVAVSGTQASVSGEQNYSYAPANVDSFFLSPSGNEKTQTMTVTLRQKALGPIGLKLSYAQPLDEPDLRSPTGNSVDIPIRLPKVASGATERDEGKALILAENAFRINPMNPEGLQATSIAQIHNPVWHLDSNDSQLGFLLAESAASLTLKVERRKPQLTLREARTVRIEDGVIRSTARFYYDVLFSGIKSLRIDVPEKLSGRLQVRTGDWRETMMVPQPEDVTENHVAWEFATKSELIGSGVLELSWEDELTQLDVGKSIPLDIPRLVPRKQQPSDRLWGRIVLSKSQSVDLGESEETKGLKPIDPQYDLPETDRIAGAVAAFEFHDDWTLRLIATRYKLEEVKRTSIERGLVRANVYFSKFGTGLSVQALFRIRSVRQRLELAMPAGAEIGDIRIDGRGIVLESDNADPTRLRYMVPLTSVPPDTPFLLDIRYSVPAPCNNRIEIPWFPGVATAEETQSGPAIQKVHLAAYIPEDWILVGYQGNWAKDFSFYFDGETTEISCFPGVSSLASELLGNLPDDFSTSGSAALFSCVHPEDGNPLTLTMYGNVFGAVVFGVIVLLGILLLWVPWLRRFQIVLLLIILGVLSGFVLTTFAALLLCQTSLVYGLLIVAACWMLQFLAQCSLARMRRRRERNAAQNSVENLSAEEQSTTEPVAAEEGGGRHDA